MASCLQCVHDAHHESASRAPCLTACAMQDATGPERDLDAQLAADIAWHRGRVLLARLDASVDAREGCGSHTAPAPQGAQALPAHLRFPALALPPEHELPFGAAALAKSFEQARKLFNACAPQLRRALEYYQLDGWVTDHIQILFNLSKAYRYAVDMLAPVSCNSRGCACGAQLLGAESGHSSVPPTPLATR